MKLAGAAAGAAALVVDDPERLLWVPGAKKIFDLKPVTARQLEENVRFARGAVALPKYGDIQPVTVLPDDLGHFSLERFTQKQRDFMASRYVVTTHAAVMKFDSNWKLEGAYDRLTGRKLTPREAAMADVPFVTGSTTARPWED